jgi:hypothetical protein
MAGIPGLLKATGVGMEEEETVTKMAHSRGCTIIEANDNEAAQWEGEVDCPSPRRRQVDDLWWVWEVARQ